MAGITTALIAGATALGGAAIASNSADRQSRAITQSSDAATQVAREQYQQSRQDMLPWITTGTDALAEIRRRLGLPASSPSPMNPTGSGMGGSGAGGQFGVGGGSQSGGNQPGVVQQLFNTATQGGMNPGVNTLATQPFPGSDTAVLSSPAPSPAAELTPKGTNALAPQAMVMDPGNPLIAGGPNVNTGAPLVNGGPNVMTMTGTGQPTGQPTTTIPDFGSFYASPGYQFRMDEGNRQINANRAARGMLGSGDTLRELTRYGQGVASEEWGNQLNQLFNLAGLGQTSTASSGAQGMNYANMAGNNALLAGQARASAYGTQANAWGGALGQLGGGLFNYFGAK